MILFSGKLVNSVNVYWIGGMFLVHRKVLWFPISLAGSGKDYFYARVYFTTYFKNGKAAPLHLLPDLCEGRPLNPHGSSAPRG